MEREITFYVYLTGIRRQTIDIVREATQTIKYIKHAIRIVSYLKNSFPLIRTRTYACIPG